MDSLTPDARLDCGEVVRSLWEYLDRRAPSEHVDAINEHLSWCNGCRAHFDFEEKLVKTLAALGRQHTDPERLRKEVLEVLRSAGFDTHGHS